MRKAIGLAVAIMATSLAAAENWLAPLPSVREFVLTTAESQSVSISTGVVAIKANVRNGSITDIRVPKNLLSYSGPNVRRSGQ